MKPGDKVWIFSNLIQRILEIEVDSVIHDGADVIVLEKYTMEEHLFGFDAFESREALCEHYRKIFEK